MIYLSIDPGAKRTGVAVGDDETGHAGPVDVIRTADPKTLLREIRRLIEAYAADVLVVGMPYHMDGTRGAGAEKARSLAESLADEFSLPVRLADERLTSYAADHQMKRSGLTHGQKKARRDAIAAAAILRDFLDRNPGGV